MCPSEDQALTWFLGPNYQIAEEERPGTQVMKLVPWKKNCEFHDNTSRRRATLANVNYEHALSYGQPKGIKSQDFNHYYLIL